MSLTYAITDTDARRLLTAAQYAALEAGEPHGLTSTDIVRDWKAYTDDVAAVEAIKGAGGGWIIDDDGDTTWVEPAEAAAVTAATITDEQIESLRREAAEAGDLLQVAICDVALADGLSDIADVDDVHRAALEAMGIIPEHIDADVRARAECARVIADAAAQVED